MKNEAKLTFFEATSIIIGHGVGAGILSVPYIASRNNVFDMCVIFVLVYGINLLLHFMIAELSYNNGGMQFIKCFENDLFIGKYKKIMAATAFILLGFSVIVNVSGFITGGGAVLESWLGIDYRIGMSIFFVAAALVVFFGLKLVGIFEKFAVIFMLAVIVILIGASFKSGRADFSSKFIAWGNVLALYSIISFSLSAVMSVPQVVKGLDGNIKKIRGAIALGTGINLMLIVLITFTTLYCVGNNVTQNGAIVDMSAKIGGWVSVIGYIFSLLALATSFWANTLNLRDVVEEQLSLGNKKSWLLASIPCLGIALLGLTSFVGFARLASVVQVLTGVGVILAYNHSRKGKKENTICGKFGSIPFQIIVIAGSLIATVGALIKIV